MDFQLFAACKAFTTALLWALIGFLTGMRSVIDLLILIFFN